MCTLCNDDLCWTACNYLMCKSCIVVLLKGKADFILKYFLTLHYFITWHDLKKPFNWRAHANHTMHNEDNMFSSIFLLSHKHFSLSSHPFLWRSTRYRFNKNLHWFHLRKWSIKLKKGLVNKMLHLPHCCTHARKVTAALTNSLDFNNFMNLKL